MPKSSSLGKGAPSSSETRKTFVGLEVAVGDAGRVGGVERARDAAEDGHRRVERQAALAVEEGVQRSSPSSSSMTKYCRPSASAPNEKMSMMLRWRIWLTARASATKRETICRVGRVLLVEHLDGDALADERVLDRAYTVPKAPAPSLPSMRYSPTVWPGVSSPSRSAASSSETSAAPSAAQTL